MSLSMGKPAGMGWGGRSVGTGVTARDAVGASVVAGEGVRDAAGAGVTLRVAEGDVVESSSPQAEARAMRMVRARRSFTWQR